MRLKKISLTVLVIILLASFEFHAAASDDDPPKRVYEEAKVGFGITIMGGTFNSMLYTNDKYFGQTSFNSHFYVTGGAGLIVDFPLSKRFKLWLNPEFQMVSLQRPVISFSLTFQSFLSRSFFISYGGSACLDNFEYGGAGPNLGLGFRAGKRNSFFIQSRLFYRELPESGELITYSAFQVPITIGYRIDLASTVKKKRPVVVPDVKIPPKNEPGPAKPVEQQKVNQQQKPDSVPIEPVEVQQIIQQQKPDSVPIEPVEVQQIIQQQKPDSVPVRPAEDQYVRQPIRELISYSYNELTLLLKRVVSEEDYLMADKIQKEIERRESNGNFVEIPGSRLEEMLREAVKAENYTRAADIQEEINKRNK